MVDSYANLRCPACGNLMKKIFIPEAGCSVDICSDGCGGIYFDNKELRYFKDADDSTVAEINEYLNKTEFTPVDSTKIRMCPNCATKMVKTKIFGLEVEVDTCYSCGGVFLDHGEFDLIRNQVIRRKVTENTSKPNVELLQEFYRETQQDNNILTGGSSNLFTRRHSLLFDLLGYLIR